MKFEKQPMVNWYNIKQLASTGVKTVISGIFGNFADRREMQAALSTEATPPPDFSDRTELWIDYVSDLGDGFNSTYTVAHLLAQSEVDVNDDKLKRGDILVMGGDAVYPTPEADEYRNRLQGPYNAAFPWISKEAAARLFVLPGNHDWYDGLTNFLKLFCQGRSLGNWLTEQQRSYFAIKLPFDYWLLGIDVQLNADIDLPQISYFRKIAEKEFKPETKIILCTAEPSWVFKSWNKKDKSHSRIQFFIERVLLGKDCDYHDKNKDIHIAAIVTGDLHHYSRYEASLHAGLKTQLITAGGGGAFTHPTHLLKESMAINDEGGQATLKASFPSFAQSKGLAWRNLIFPYYSPSMVLFLGFFHLFTTWFLQSGNPEGRTFMELASKLPMQFDQLGEFFMLIVKSIRHSPSVVLLNLLLLYGLVLFTDTVTGKGKLNYLAGFGHGVVQVISLYVLIWVFSIINLGGLNMGVNRLDQVGLLTLEMGIGGGLVSAFIFGVYLLVSVLVLKIHPTEAFSSFRWTGYKNFLRIHVHKNGVSIYPIGIKKVVKNWRDVGPPEKPSFTGDKIEYSLIDGPIKL